MSDTSTPTPTIIEAAPVAGPTVTIPSPTPAPAPTPVAAAPVAPTEPTPAAVTPEPAPTAKETGTVLADAMEPKTEPPKPEEPVKPTESKEGDQSVEPAPPPSYDAFKMPEGISLEPERVKEFTNMLSELETKSKGTDHATFQEFGQKAVDFYINETKNVINTLQKAYTDSWEKVKTSWKDDFVKDPTIGGAKLSDTVTHALNFIRTHGGTAEEIAEFKALMNSTGLGNHKVMIRLLSNAGRVMAEATPLAAPKPVVAQPKSKLEALYGKQA